MNAMYNQYQVFRDKAGEFRWRLVAANGEIVAQSESYPTKQEAREAVGNAADVAAEARTQDGPIIEDMTS